MLTSFTMFKKKNGGSVTGSLADSGLIMKPAVGWAFLNTELPSTFYTLDLEEKSSADCADLITW